METDTSTAPPAPTMEEQSPVAPDSDAQTQEPGDDEAILKRLNESTFGKGRDTPVNPGVLPLWERLKGSIKGLAHRDMEIGRSVLRGVPGAVSDVADTAGDVANAVGLSGTGKALKGFATSNRANADQVFGKRSDDGIAQFAEEATNFATKFVATRSIGTSVAANSVRGAIANAASDPHSEGLAELVAKSPIPIAKQVGEILSVHEDDSPIVARMKRAGAGVVADMAMESVVASARLIKAIRGGNATEEVAQQKILQDIADGTHTPEGAHVAARPNEDGTWRVEPVSEEAKAALPAETKAIPAGETPKQPGTALVKWEPPKFADRAEAEAQAGSFNAAINDRLTAEKASGGMTPEEIANSKDFVRQLSEAEGPKEVSALSAEKGFGGYDYATAGTPEELYQTFEQQAKAFQEEINGIHDKRGAVAMDLTRQRALEMTGGVPIEHLPGVVSKSLEEGGAAGVAAKEMAANFALKQLGDHISNLWGVLEERPHDLIAHERARWAILNWMGLQRAFARTKSSAGLNLRVLREFTSGAGKDMGAPAQGVLGSVSGESASKLHDTIAGMDTKDIREMARLFRMADGKPINLWNTDFKPERVHEPGFWPATRTFFKAALLSNPATIATPAIANSATSVFEGAMKTLGGAYSGNWAQAKEGLNTMYGLGMYFRESIKAANAAMRAGYSLLSPPSEIRTQFTGIMGKLTDAPMKGLIWGDEFSRVLNYRAVTRAKAIRFWQERGLEGPALANAVETDVARSITPSGLATIPQSLEYAERTTMASPLEDGALGGTISQMAQKHPAIQFIMPFIRTPANVFNYAWEGTPALNLLNKRVWDTLRNGDPEAAREIIAKTALSSTLLGAGYFAAASGNLTGNGPKDPAVRSLWLEDHKPYSVKIGDNWYSYRRLDPVGMFLGLAADFTQIAHEAPNPDDRRRTGGADEVAAGIIAALASNTLGKSYLQGLSSFMDNLHDGNTAAAKEFISGIATGFIPQVAQQANSDPYLRDAQTLVERIYAKTPGLSESVPARYNVFGEPITKAPGALNRVFNPFRDMGPAQQSVSSDLMSLGKTFSPMPQGRIMGVQVDLTDRAKYGENGVSPWEKMQEFLRNPGDGDPSLKQALTDLVKSSDWKEATSGSEQYPGGERYKMATKLLDSYQKRAVGQTLDAFPKLSAEVEKQLEMRGLSISEGQGGVQAFLRSLDGKK